MSGNRSSKNIPQIYLFWYMSLPFPHRTQSHPSFVLMKYMYNLACLHAQRYHYFQIFFFFSIKSIDIESSIGKRFTRARYPGELITLILRRKSFGGKKIKKKEKKNK